MVGPRATLARGAPKPLPTQLTSNGYMVLDTFSTTFGRPTPDAQQVRAIQGGGCASGAAHTFHALHTLAHT